MACLGDSQFQEIFYFLGGTLSVAQGGSFGSGALAGGLSSGISSATGGLLKGATKFWKAMGIVGSGSLSGGLGSAIAGGNFWDGFRQGAISSGLNHLAHSLQEIDPEKLKERILSDGKLTLREANRWYKYGNGAPLSVDAAKIDLDFLAPGDWKVGQTQSVQTLLASRDGLVYGNITLTYQGDNQFSIQNDIYDFELHRGNLNMTIKQGFKNMFRNAATNIGGALAGVGKPFTISFTGVNTVSPQTGYNLPFIK